MGQDAGYREIYDLVRSRDFIAGRDPEGYRANIRTFIKRIRNEFRHIDPGFDQIKNYARFGYRWGAQTTVVPSERTAADDAFESRD